MATETDAEPHLRALETLYDSAPVNQLFKSHLSVAAVGQSRIDFTIEESVYHAAGAAHGTIYFKMLDDAAFYAANTVVTDMFMLTTAFNLLLTRPMKAGPAFAEGRWISGHRRVLVAEARIVDSSGEETARGTGTFMRSRIPLSSLPGYRFDRPA